MNKEQVEKLKKLTKPTSGGVISEYIVKFGEIPPIPMYQSTGEDEKFLRFVKMAVDRGKPLTDEDYDKYYPTDPGVLY